MPGVGIILGMIERRRWLYFIGAGMVFLGIGLRSTNATIGTVIGVTGSILVILYVPLGIWEARRKRRANLDGESRK